MRLLLGAMLETLHPGVRLMLTFFQALNLLDPL